MDSTQLPALTARALHSLQIPDARMSRIQRALLSTVDGHRNVIELESVARAMGLPVDTLEQLREGGWIAFTANEP